MTLEERISLLEKKQNEPVIIEGVSALPTNKLFSITLPNNDTFTQGVIFSQNSADPDNHYRTGIYLDLTDRELAGHQIGGSAVFEWSENDDFWVIACSFSAEQTKIWGKFW